MQIGEQVIGAANPARFVAEPVEVGLRNRPVLPGLRRHRSIGVPHRLQPLLNPVPASANHRNAFALSQPVRRLGQCLVQGSATAICPRAVAQYLAERECLEQVRLRYRAGRLVFRPVASGLHHQHGAVCAAEVAYIVHPIGERMIAEDHAAMYMLLRVLQDRRPGQ